MVILGFVQFKIGRIRQVGVFIWSSLMIGLTYYCASMLTQNIRQSIDLRLLLRNNILSPVLTHDPPHRRSLVGIIWPLSDTGLPETHDRIDEQKKFIDEFWPYTGPNGTRAPVNNTKVILKLGHFNFDNFKRGQEYFLKDGCPLNSCVLTDDESLHETADALIMSQYTHVHPARFLPKPTHQIWIAQHWESPRMNKIDTELVKDLINWTASYRKDSTVPFGYGHYTKISSTSEESKPINYANNKTKLVAWVVSNCYSITNNRMDYGAELAKHIQVDVYGRCGTLKCPFDGDKCYAWLARSYKFFLSFENSNCKDYITEKLHRNALKLNILPIALGGLTRSDYHISAPPHSYIHVDDFSSPRELAQYLHVLDKNDTLYNTYFEWKKHWRSSYFDMRYWCRLCMMLHLADKQRYVHWYQDYTQWWTGACRQSA